MKKGPAEQLRGGERRETSDLSPEEGRKKTFSAVSTKRRMKHRF